MVERLLRTSRSIRHLLCQRPGAGRGNSSANILALLHDCLGRSNRVAEESLLGASCSVHGLLVNGPRVSARARVVGTGAAGGRSGAGGEGGGSG